MNCPNCGAPLAGNENVCPNCGTQLQNNNQNMQPMNNMMNNNMNMNNMNMNNSMPENNMNNMNTMNNPMNVNMNNMNGMNNMSSMNPTNNPTPQNNNANGGKNKLILIAVIAVVAVILVVVVMMNMKNKENQKSIGADTPSTDQVSTNSGSNITYSGYTFTYPTGYSADYASDGGIDIYSTSTAFIFEVDITNSYEDYYQEFAKRYPTQISDAELTIGGRKYLIFSVKYESGAYGSVFVSSINKYTTAVGAVVLRSGNPPTESEYKILTSILDSATSSSSFAAGEEEPSTKNPMFDPETMDPSKIYWE